MACIIVVCISLKIAICPAIALLARVITIVHFGFEQGMKVVKGLRKLLHPPGLMVLINCGLDSCGLDQGMKVVKGLKKLLHPPKLMVWINCGMDSCGLEQGMKIVKGLRKLLLQNS